jgi:Arm DNA-binding domain
MRKKLTAKTIESLPAAQGRRYEVWDIALPSFGIRVARTGRKTWFVTCRIQGTLRRHKIGTHPALSLHDARELARKFPGDVQRGKYDRAGASTNTLGETVPVFIERYARPKNRGWEETQRILGKFTPCLGSHSIKLSAPTLCASWTISLPEGRQYEPTGLLRQSKSCFPGLLTGE